MRCDVHHEIGCQLFVLNVVMHCLWSPLLLLIALIVKSFYFFQSGVKTGIECQSGCPSMVRMAVVRGIAEDYFGPTSAENAYYFQPNFGLVFEQTIRYVERFAEDCTKDFGRFNGLGGADLP